MENLSFLIKGMKSISKEVGILSNTVRLPIMNHDPKIINFGIWPCNTQWIGGEKFEGRSGACNTDWSAAMLATLGETFERYSPAFYNIEESIKSTRKSIIDKTIDPAQFALFHEEQHEYFRNKRYNMVPFNDDVELTWFMCTDLTTGANVYCPGQFIYMPFTQDKQYITAGNSTGLASHTSYYKAVLTAIYECIERDSFVITWMNNIVPKKIIINRLYTS